MNIQLQNLHIPYIPITTSIVWGQQFEFQFNTSYLIKANSGKGKTTLVNTLYGLNNNYKGDVLLNQKNYRQLTPSDWCAIRQKQISIVFQDLKLFLDKTALENIQVKNELTQHISDDTLLHFVKQLSLEHTLHLKVKTLSYGERQRLVIIRSLLMPFQFLLLDEPFSHLDKTNIEKCVELITHEVQRQQATIIHFDLENTNELNCKHIVQL